MSFNHKLLVCAAATSLSACATGFINEITEKTAETALGADRLFSVESSEVISRERRNNDDQEYFGELQTSLRLYGKIYRAAEEAEETFFDEFEEKVNATIDNVGPYTSSEYKGGMYYQRLRELRRAGWEASRQLCTYKLDVLGESRSSFEHGKDQLEILTGLTATIMAITDASAQAIGLFAAGESWLSASQSASQDYLFITPDAKALERLVLLAQDEYEKAILDDEKSKALTFTESINPNEQIDYIVDIQRRNAPKSLGEAISQIQDYNSYCTANGLRNIITESVEKATPYFDTSEQQVRITASKSARQQKLDELTTGYAERKQALVEERDEINTAIKILGPRIEEDKTRLQVMESQYNELKAAFEKYKDNEKSLVEISSDTDSDTEELERQQTAFRLSGIALSRITPIENAHTELKDQKEDIEALRRQIDRNELRQNVLNQDKAELDNEIEILEINRKAIGFQ